MKAKIYFLGLILSLGIISCEKGPFETSAFSLINGKENFGDVNNLLISYSRNSSWCGYSFELLIEQNGQLFIATRDGNSNEQERSMNLLSEKELTLIKEKIQNALLINIDDYYGFGIDQPFDLPVTSIEYRIGNRSGSAYFYHPDENDEPKELYELLLAVNQLISKYEK